jgi:hypothetical protein
VHASTRSLICEVTDSHAHINPLCTCGHCFHHDISCIQHPKEKMLLSAQHTATPTDI